MTYLINFKWHKELKFKGSNSITHQIVLRESWMQISLAFPLNNDMRQEKYQQS